MITRPAADAHSRKAAGVAHISAAQCEREGGTDTKQCDRDCAMAMAGVTTMVSLSAELPGLLSDKLSRTSCAATQHDHGPVSLP